MANLFYYSMYLVNQRFHAKEGFYYSIVQVIKVINTKFSVILI